MCMCVCKCVCVFIPCLEEYSQSEAQNAVAYSAVRHGKYIVFHESFPAFITATKFSRRTSGSARWPSLIQLSLDFATAEPNNCLEFDILKFKSSEKPVTRDGRKTEYFMQTSRNLRNSDRNPGTVEKRVSVSETFVTFVQNKCSEARILNDLQPEQSRDNFYTGFCWQLIQKKTEEFKPDTVTFKTSS